MSVHGELAMETMMVSGLVLPSRDLLAVVGYNAIREQVPSTQRLSDDEIAASPLCLKSSPIVTDYLGKVGLGLCAETVERRTGSHEVGTLQVHRYTLVSNAEVPDGLIVDLTWKQFLQKCVRYRFPNVFVGPRREIRAVLQKYPEERDAYKLY